MIWQHVTPVPVVGLLQVQQQPARPRLQEGPELDLEVCREEALLDG